MSSTSSPETSLISQSVIFLSLSFCYVTGTFGASFVRRSTLMCLKELRNAIRNLTKLLERLQISRVEAALRWICRHSELRADFDGVILGASKPEYVIQNVEAVRQGPLP